MNRTLSARRIISTPIAEKLEERKLFAANVYFKAASSTVIDVWTDTTHQGTGMPSGTISTSGSGSVTGNSTGIIVTFDETAGQAIQSGGFTVNGNSGSVGSNLIFVIGTSGNDTITSSTTSTTFGSTTVTKSNIGANYFNFFGGTDSFTETSGFSVLTASASGSGIVTRQFSTLSISSGATFYVQPPNGTHADRTVLEAANSGFIINGALDLTSNDLIVTNGNWGGINGNVATGNNIKTSVTSSGSNYTTLGVTPNNGGSGTTALYSTFDGISVSYSAILIKWTYDGDANDDGVINSSDYSLIDNGYTHSLTGWYNGDFNYDGVVNGSDFTLIDNAYNGGGSPL